MAIFIVGIHNKPGKTPLDSTTKTGRIVDRVCVRLALLGVFGVVYKTNLYDLDAMPDPMSYDGERWAKRVGFDPDKDVVVTLGLDVSKRMRHYLNGIGESTIARLGHPGRLRAASEENEYVINAANDIKELENF